MKIRKKQSNSFSNILPEQIFEEKQRIETQNQDRHLTYGKNPGEKEINLGAVDNLDIMDISVSNFQFANFNKLDLETLDMINEDTIAKEELFQCVVEPLIIDKTAYHVKGKGIKTKNISDVSSSSQIDLSKNIPCTNSNESSSVVNEENATSGLSRRALKRKQKLEESKLQCPVRTTARHYMKMLDFFEANQGLATGQLPKVIYRKKWRELTEILNQQGIGEKTTEKWQKTWSDYKLHLRKKMSGIKRSGKALDVPNQFSDLDKRALSNMGITSCDESSKIAITKRFNPDVLESEDSCSHSTAQSVQSTTYTNVPTSTTDGSPVNRRKSVRQLRHGKLLYRRKQFREYRTKTREYHDRSLRELIQLRLTVNNGLNRIGDILERLVKKSEANSVIASNLAEAAVQIANVATTFGEIVGGFNDKSSNTRY